MAERKIDIVVLYNMEEPGIETIINELEARGISTHAWVRDTPDTEDQWSNFQEAWFNKSIPALLLLGRYGWMPPQLQSAREAKTLGKPLIPVMTADPPEETFRLAEDLFRKEDLFSLDGSSASYSSLIEIIRGYSDIPPEERVPDLQSDPAPDTPVARRTERIVNALINGSEEDRYDVLEQIKVSSSIDRAGLAMRLADQLLTEYGPHNSDSTAASVRSWMLTCLLWANAEYNQTRLLAEKHIDQFVEPANTVRFWTLAALYQVRPSYFADMVPIARKDTAPEVALLAEVIGAPAISSVIGKIKSKLQASKEGPWTALRVLRVVPVPELARDICKKLAKAKPDTNMEYDTLYALSHPEVAREAAPTVYDLMGVEEVTDHIFAAVRSARQDVARQAARQFAIFLGALDYEVVMTILKEREKDGADGDTARWLREFVNDLLYKDDHQVFVAGYASDSIDVEDDSLGIQEDVQTLTAVMLAEDVKPPLAIGLFGDWGTGKSFFMDSMHSAVEKLKTKGNDSRFCTNVCQIKFNAWHYIDTNLWASLVSNILEQLAAYVAPEKKPEEMEAALLAELGTAQAIMAEAKAEKEGAQKQLSDRQGELQTLQLKREQKEIALTDLRIKDLEKIFKDQPELKTNLEKSLTDMGVPAAVDSVSDLSHVLAEANTLRSRMVAFLLAIFKGQNRWLVIGGLVLVLIVIPGIVYLLPQTLKDDVMVQATALFAKITAAITGITLVLRTVVGMLKSGFEKVEQAKLAIDRTIAEKRQKPTKAEEVLQNEIAGLKAQEQEAQTHATAAAAKVVELEERIRAIREGRSLAKFLAERTNSDDYRKHLGLISTIRKDFESLATRLDSGNTKLDDKLEHVDRIILYIDDLDRCPADKVMDVLQAVHLLLAYPLFVVVVGVDPRWLLHSLGTTYSAFQSSGARYQPSSGMWRTTPQNYLEKIFQIPFNLNRMNVAGYNKLIGGLMAATGEPKEGDGGAPLPFAKEAGEVKPAEKKRGRKGRKADAGGSGTGEAQPGPGGSTDGGQAGQGAAQGGGAGGAGAKTVKKGEKPFVVREEAMLIRGWEVKFAERLFELIPTPRSAKRFSNIYRILKARVRHDDLPAFEGTSEVPGTFQVPMLLLAILLGAPEAGMKLFPILKRAETGHDVGKVFDMLKVASGPDAIAFSSLWKKIEEIVTDPDFPDDPRAYGEWVPRVSRFSFDVGRAVQATQPG